MKNIFLLISFLLITQLSMAQIDMMKQVLEDELSMIDEGILTLRFIDAVSGNPVQGATVKLSKMDVFVTGMDGTIGFPLPSEDGEYFFEFSKEGYIKANYSFELIEGIVFKNRFHVSPVIDIKAVRIVLEWNKKPDDLDLHLQKINGFHISYRNMSASIDGAAKLDRDALSGYGPETITIMDLDDNAEYLCFVHDYSNKEKPSSRNLSAAGATVTVYADGELKNIFQIDEKQTGNNWEVFRINKGKIIPQGLVKSVR